MPTKAFEVLGHGSPRLAPPLVARAVVDESLARRASSMLARVAVASHGASSAFASAASSGVAA